MPAVRYVEKKYYIGVKRYTSGAFLRHRLGSALAQREVTSKVHASLEAEE